MSRVLGFNKARHACAIAKLQRLKREYDDEVKEHQELIDMKARHSLIVAQEQYMDDLRRQINDTQVIVNEENDKAWNDDWSID